MKASTILWHLSRDNPEKLFRFCERRKQSIEWLRVDSDKSELVARYNFDNGGYIIIEMLREVSCTEHFQIMDYSLGF